MFSRISDAELFDELKRRFAENKKAYHDLQILTKKLERLNAKLRESEALKSNFISNIKNELNNPLTSLSIMARELATNYDTINVDKIKSFAENLYVDLLSINHNLKNIFLAAEIESGEIKPFISKIDLKSFIENTISELSFFLKINNLALDVIWMNENEIENNDFFSDSEKLQMILTNILWNSIQYSTKNSKITLKLSLQDNILNFWISDYGYLMSTDDIEKFFGEFRHISVDLTKKDRGYSLSMNVTKALVDFLSGSISVSNNESGKGCTFIVTIPSLQPDSDVNVSFDGNEFFF
jgi:signal transduction histidine kinase